jgi:hypothetical protein
MTITLEWQEREPPLAVAGALARGTVAAALAKALFLDDARRQKCVAIGAGDALVVVGDDLPWVPDVIWLGLDEGLLMPTRLQPCVDGIKVATSLVASALFRNRTRTGIAVVTPGYAVLVSRPSGPPPVELLAQGVGL